MPTLKERNAEQFRKSIAGEKCDHHAVFNYYTFPFFHSITHVDLDRYFHDPETCMRSQLEAYEQLEGCGNLSPDMGPVAEASSLGGKVVFDKAGFISVKPSGVETIEDVEQMKPGDPYGDNYMRRALETLEYMVRNCPKGYKVNPHIIMGPFTVAAQLRGINDICMDVLEDPDFVNALLDVILETQIRFIHAQEEILGYPLHHILVCDDISSFLNVGLYRQIVVPTYQRLFAEFPDTQRWLHNDANAHHIAGEIANSGFSAWQLHPSITPDEAARSTGGKLTLLGGLSPVEFAGLSVEQAEQKCREVIASFRGNSRCVLSTGGSINQVPIENIRAMFRVAETVKI